MALPALAASRAMARGGRRALPVVAAPTSVPAWTPVRTMCLANFGQMDAPLEASSQGWTGIKRFYDSVGVRGIMADGTFSEDGTGAEAWQVLIQGRVLRTNALNDLILPSKALALAIAGEFASQRNTVVSATTPLYNLACTAIDSYGKDDLRMEASASAVDAVLAKTGESDLAISRTDDPVAPATEMVDVDRVAATLVKVTDFGEDPNRPEIRYSTRAPGQASAMSSMAGAGGESARLREMTKDFLETDTVSYRATLGSGDPDEALLRRRQDKYYDPIMQWFLASFGTKLGFTEGLGNVQHPTAAYELCEELVDSGDHFFRAALHSCLGTTKSTAISLALLFRHINVEQAYAASRVEEEYQIEISGFVEDGHDTARVMSKVHLGAAATMLWLSPGSRPEAPPVGQGEEAVAAAMDRRLARVAVRRRRDQVQAMLEAEEKARMRQRVAGAAGETVPQTPQEKEAAELEWMEAELLAMQQQTNRMAASSGMDVPYPEAGTGQ